MKKVSIDDLISKVDIVSVISNFSSLVKAGASFKTLCNVHGDKTPSLSINPKKQIYKCFVCDHGGNALDYLIWAQKFNFNQALEYLIKESGENIDEYKSLISSRKHSEKEIRLFEANKDASDLFNYYLNIAFDEKDENILPFLRKRNITKKIIDRFKLGFAPTSVDEASSYIKALRRKGHDDSTLINASLLSGDGEKQFFSNKFIFPIIDEEDNVVGFSGRKIFDNDDNKDEPKYLNSKESLIFKKSQVMYNYNVAKKFDQIIVVEGFMDVIAFYRIGYENTIALMGLNLSNENLYKLKQHKEVLIFLDSDEAGKKSTLKLIKIFIENKINGFVLDNPYSKDADEIVSQEDGKEKLANVLNTKTKFIKFIFDYFMSGFDKSDYESLKQAIIEVYKYSRTFDDFFKLEIISMISRKYAIEKDVIIKYFEYKPNMVELKELKNKNIVTKQTLEIELNEPLNINKLIISIWQNPSFLLSLNIDRIRWPRTRYMKMYEEIRDFHNQGKNISKDTEQFIKDNETFFKSKESLPKDKESFEELIIRTHKDTKEAKISYIDELINHSTDEEYKKKLLALKLETLSRKE